MTFKVAIASSNGKSVNQHFGQTPNFLIFEIKGNEDFEFIEVRKNIPPSDNLDLLENHDKALAKSADLISDCNLVLASHIGPGAVKTLLSYKIKPYSTPDLMIEKALKKLASSKLVSNPIPRPVIH